MNIKNCFKLIVDDTNYYVRLAFISESCLSGLDSDSNLTYGYYMDLTPFTLDDNSDMILHRDYRISGMVKKTLLDTEGALENILSKKKELAIKILKTQYTSIQVKNVHKEIEKKMKLSKINKMEEKGFNTIAGYKEVKEELLEIIDYTKNPDRYKKLGATLPKGILMYGPPGTGKTLFARALSEETDMEFLYASGSEFVEKYQGVGARRVRDLFEKARENAPSIVFIDEIDAIGLKRSEDKNSNEKDQTLNQLLIELDGFNIDSNTIVICATNRVELLDEALKRPGRLDKHIYVGNPDVKTRHELFEIHTKNKPLSKDVDIEKLSKSTHGCSCADIKNICNQASLFAIRENREDVCQLNFENAIETNIGGLKSKSKRLNENEKERVSYHESGHAVANYILGYNKIQKVSIIPRGKSLGCVMTVSDDDKYINTKEELLNKITILLAGRASEKIIFGNYSTGASNDLEKASQLAFDIVSRYGLYDEDSLFTLSSTNMHDSLFNEYKNKADDILVKCNKDAIDLLSTHKNTLSIIAKELMEKEELTCDDITRIFSKN